MATPRLDVLSSPLAGADLVSTAEVGSAAWAWHVGVCLDEAVQAARPDLLVGSLVDPKVDVGAGVGVDGGRVVAARRGFRECTVVTGAPALYASGLRAATAFVPLCAVHQGQAHVLPASGLSASSGLTGEVAVVGPYRGTFAPGDGWPRLHPLVLAAAEAGVRVRLLTVALDAASLALDGNGPGAAVALPDYVATAVPGAPPGLDLTAIPVPGAPPDAPDLVAPVFGGAVAVPAGYDPPGVILPFLAESVEDSELASVAVQEQRALLEEYAARLQDRVAVFRAEVDAFLAEPRVYESEVAGYRGEVEAYAARVSAAVQAYLAQHVQAGLARFTAVEGAVVTAYRARVEGALGEAAEGRQRWQIRLSDLERRRAGVERALQDARSEHARRLALCRTGGDPLPQLTTPAEAAR